MERSRKFYENVLGQKVEADFGENISFGGFAIHSRSHFKMLIDNKEVLGGGNNFELYFEYDNVEQIVEKLKAEETVFVHELREQPWRQQVVRFYDPDKNIVEIGEPLGHLILRLFREGNSIGEVCRITGLDSEFVEETIKMHEHTTGGLAQVGV